MCRFQSKALLWRKRSFIQIFKDEKASVLSQYMNLAARYILIFTWRRHATLDATNAAGAAKNSAPHPDVVVIKITFSLH